MTPGRLLLLFRQNCRQGWSTPYWRDRVRPRILATQPIETATAGEVELHALTGRDDALNLIWSLKSFYHYSQRDYPLVIHDDGMLGDSHAALLAEHFPHARLVRRQEADELASARLAAYPRCAAYRRSHPLALKALDAGLLLRAPRMLLVDSDLLFFAAPEKLVRHAENGGPNVFNADVASGLNFTAGEAAQRFGIRLVERINTGLAVLQREVFNLDWMEEFLATPPLLAGHIWRVEQTLLALAASRLGAELLPAEYRVSLSRGTKGCVVKHYVGAVRHLMYREGMARLKRQGFLEAIAE